jgi:hypothetical protein
VRKRNNCHILPFNAKGLFFSSFFLMKNIDYHRRDSKKFWNQHCVGIVAKFALHELGYTVQPRPYVAKVDLAAVFFARPKMLAENIFFGKFLFFSCSLFDFLISW